MRSETLEESPVPEDGGDATVFSVVKTSFHLSFVAFGNDFTLRAQSTGAGGLEEQENA